MYATMNRWGKRPYHYTTTTKQKWEYLHKLYLICDRKHIDSSLKILQAACEQFSQIIKTTLRSNWKESDIMYSLFNGSRTDVRIHERLLKIKKKISCGTFFLFLVLKNEKNFVFSYFSYFLLFPPTNLLVFYSRFSVCHTDHKLKWLGIISIQSPLLSFFLHPLISFHHFIIRSVLLLLHEPIIHVLK